MTRRHGLALVAVIAAVGVGPTSASAHSELVASSPRDGARLATAPEAVVLRFSEPLRRALRVRVLDGRGRDRVLRVVFRQRTPRMVRAPLRSLGRGRHRVEWVVVAADGFTQSGSFGFRVTGRRR